MMKLKIVSYNDLNNLEWYFNKRTEETEELLRQLKDTNDKAEKAVIVQRVKDKKRQIKKEKYIVQRLLSSHADNGSDRVNQAGRIEKKCPKVP